MNVNLHKLRKNLRSRAYILIVMRHAKAEALGEGDDRARKITDKGKKQAKAVAKALEALDLVPDRIATSSAERTVETMNRMLKYFGDGPKVDVRLSLYQGGIQSILDEIHVTKPKRHIVMILGHEPTVSVSCEWLATSDSDPAQLDMLHLGLSPASLAIFACDKPFSEWTMHGAELVAVLTPHDCES
ncbi:histidine phosphatase family protein [Bifidobacterium aquikefiricola]|uniref:Histidine phosphatase family protein n=1 Tax=Bifidobacterium aquikefiricola TaxID=3059038 RepID=A0AB39U8H9_9BIFI